MLKQTIIMIIYFQTLPTSRMYFDVIVEFSQTCQIFVGNIFFLIFNKSFMWAAITRCGLHNSFSVSLKYQNSFAQHKNIVISLTFLVQRFCVKAQFSHSFAFSRDSPETMRKLGLSTKFSHQEIRWNCGICCSNSHLMSYPLLHVTLFNAKNCWGN